MRDLCLSAVSGYLLGSIPTADIASRLSGGPDLRQSGSGNPGASNAAAVLGPKAGAAVLVVDIAKGAIAGNVGRHVGGQVLGPALAQVASTSAVVGHCYPVWSKFSGGKGVATGVGQVLATFPAYFPIDLAVALATVTSPRFKSKAFAATMSSNVAWVLAGVIWQRRSLPNGWGPRPTPALPVGALISSLVMLQRFRQSM